VRAKGADGEHRWNGIALGRRAFVSVLGYRCGAVGGQMLRGSAPEQDRAIGRAIDHGIT
jgi:hypothetical protein